MEKLTEEKIQKIAEQLKGYLGEEVQLVVMDLEGYEVINKAIKIAVHQSQKASHEELGIELKNDLKLPKLTVEERLYLILKVIDKN